MFTSTVSFLGKTACIACIALLAACSPKFDWREVRGSAAPFVVLLPAKPASHTRTINLDGIEVSMTMTAADVDGVMFAVGTAELPDEARAQQALAAMKTALVRNIGGSVRKETVSAPGALPRTINIEAAGAESRVLFGRFVANGRHIYQVIAVGKENALPPEAVDTFLTSFKIN
ncbi:MAG TPA: hypothetical protein VEB70_00795 [Noviherbaspirillum sp.]|nr:hypothetical protein [Noviherbaspirillum sp.]